MLRLIAAELRHRCGRALALLAGIAVATASFTVLTGATASSRLDIQGNVDRHFRTIYDLLVRPRGAIQPLERRKGLIQQAFASGIFGGITMDQLEAVRGAPGVDVAAPLAVYVTRNQLVSPPPHVSGQDVRPCAAEQVTPDLQVPICPGATHTRSAFAPAARTWLWCWSTRGDLGQDVAALLAGGGAA